MNIEAGMRNLEPIIDKDRPDCIIDNSHQKFLFPLAEKYKVAYLPVCHNLNIPQWKQKDMNIVGLSKRHAQVLKNAYGVEVRHVYNGLDPMKFRFIKPKMREKYFCLVARASPEKGILQAIHLCRDANIPLTVTAPLLPGDNQTYRLAVARACIFRSPIVYKGELSNEDKNMLIARSKCQIFFPQIPEPFGLSVIESLLSGVPVIASDMGAMSELIREGKDGYVIPVERDVDGKERYVPGAEGWYELVMDNAKLISAIQGIQSNTLDLHEIRTNAMEQWSYQRMARDYLVLVQEVLKGVRW